MVHVHMEKLAIFFILKTWNLLMVRLKNLKRLLRLLSLYQK